MTEYGIRNYRINQPVIPVALLHADAKPPVQGQQFDAGFDLSSVEATTIGVHSRDMIGTGIAVAIPPGFVGYIKPRSGLAAKHGIDVLGGVIDSGYRGEVKVILLNTGTLPFTVNVGDRIAQLVIQQVMDPEYQVVETISESLRGANGFGSTGVR